MARRDVDDRYKWVALANTTAATFMAVLDGSIVIIAMPAIFRGIHLDPLAPGNIAFLLWMIMGYRLVQAVFVAASAASATCSVGSGSTTPGSPSSRSRQCSCRSTLSWAPKAALWLIGWRFLQAIGGSMLMANSAAILTDAFPEDQRGFALGINQVAGLAGQFIGLVLGGLLAEWDWRAVFWINVPVGVFGTLWAYYRLREVGTKSGGRIDWWGNGTFTLGLGSLLVAITIGIQPYHGEAMGWTNPEVLLLLCGGLALLGVFVLIETQGRRPDAPALALPHPCLHVREHRELRGAAGPGWAPVHARDLAAGDLAPAARLRLQLDPALGGDLPAAR